MDILEKIIKDRKKWLAKNGIEDWNDEDTIHVAEKYLKYQLTNKNYRVFTPGGRIISVKEYMESDDYTIRLEQQDEELMAKREEKEMMKLYRKSKNKFLKIKS
jgi:hypothetical protein